MAVLALLAAAGASNWLLGWAADAGFEPQAWERKVRDRGYEVDIRRDKWGIPHIFAKRDRDLAFGVAWAHGEDALEDTETLIRMIKGLAGSHRGAEGARSDWLLAAMESRSLAHQAWKEGDALSPQARDYLEAYADGLNYFAAKNPDLVDRSLYPVAAEDLVAGMHFQVPQFYGLGEVVAGLATGAQGSNAIAVAPTRGWGETHLVINSHQPLEGPFSWYEMRLHSEEGLQLMGGGFPGTPFVYVGFNDELGWAATVNRPPGLTVRYRLELDQNNPRKYLLDGVWRDMRVVAVPIRVRLFGNFFWTLERELEYTEHGLVFRDDRGAVALSWEGAEDAGQAEQWYRMNKARSLEDWKAALRLRQLPSLNLTYADRQGNIYFLYNAKLRKRPPGFDWKREVDGTDSSLIQAPLLALDELPQSLNPSSGFLLSANQHPFAVTVGQDAPQERYFPESWGVEDRVTNRGVRGLELLNQPGSITSERLLGIKMDHAYSQNWEAVRLMRQFTGLDLPAEEDLREAQRILYDWDLATDLENRGAALGTCVLSNIRAALREGDGEESVEDEALVDIARGCIAEVKDLGQGLEPAWKYVNRLWRGGESWPLQGGPDTLRAVYSGTRDGVYRATAGDGLTYFVRWDRSGAMHSRGIHQYGASRDPKSAHYADQAPLFAQGELRETSYAMEDIEANAQKVLRLPLGALN